KVKQGVAAFFDSKNTLSSNPFMYDEKHRLKNLLDIEKLNPRVKNKCLHISFNPSSEDYLKLGDTAIQKEIRNMMDYMGYGNQPYFVYKHRDLERVHFHIVSTRIDRETGRKIKDSYEKQKMQKFIVKLMVKTLQFHCRYFKFL
ncbi:relaxase/mobilization nuclease domain-containing protein, partial [Maribellus maritimus]|uniref:relaxase/mobilization nuclease domain-containing protein n=1 Tax=Maribellus maritimus TaxID=2870838 RepID=UPI001EEACA3C